MTPDNIGYLLAGLLNGAAITVFVMTWLIKRAAERTALAAAATFKAKAAELDAAITAATTR